MPKPNKITIAEVISFLTNPIFVLILSLALISKHFDSDGDKFWQWTIVGAFLLIGPALLYASFDWYKDRKIDIDLSRRRERLVPMMLATLGAVIGSFLINTKVNNHSLLLVSYVLVSMLISLTFITFVWKISLHTSTLAAAVTLLVLFQGMAYLPAIFLVLPVAWARLILKQHSRLQVTAGALWGVGITLGAWFLFR